MKYFICKTKKISLSFKRKNRPFCNERQCGEAIANSFYHLRANLLHLESKPSAELALASKFIFFLLTLSLQKKKQKKNPAPLFPPRCCTAARENASPGRLLSPPRAGRLHKTNAVSAHVEQNGQRSISRLIAGIVLPRIPLARVMLISRSWSTFGMAGWSFCQRRIGRDCVQPFSMFSLPVSRCFRVAGEAAKQQPRE